LNQYAQVLFEDYAARRHVRPGDVEKLADDLVSRLPRALPRYDPARASFRRWVIGIGQKIVADYFRKSPKVVSIDERSEEWADTEREPLDQAYERERTAEDVRRAADGLPVRRREVLRLRYYRGLSYREIADRMKIDPGTARVQMVLALRDLADRLGFPGARRSGKARGESLDKRKARVRGNRK
jgi:RNA polymerase sigma-70 factor (ECF subfamily)